MKITIVLFFLSTSSVWADVRADSTLCNYSQRPVEFSLYNHNDITGG